MTVTHNERMHICRTPLAEEGNTMSLWSRIRKLLRLKPTVAERVRDLTAQRVQIEQQRFEIDQKVDALEASERQYIEQGATAASGAEKKQLAGKLMRARRELRRHKAQAQMFSQQIDVIGTHIHHLTLAEQGKRLELPSSEDLTREAAEAEQVVAQVAANADLAASIEVSPETPAMAQEEADILKEFEQAAQSSTPAPEAQSAAPAREQQATPERRESTPPLPAEPENIRSAGKREAASGKRDAAGPELG